MIFLVLLGSYLSESLYTANVKSLLSLRLVKLKIAAFVASVCGVKKKSLVNFRWSVLHIILKNCQGHYYGINPYGVW